MDISWKDLNNIQDPGDFPYRDGLITVTFAEIAIWKKNPQARFRLMRKNPAYAQSRYAIGQQVEDGMSRPEELVFYKSSNGDSWFLTQYPNTTRRSVVHVPNPESGGRIATIDIDSFLSSEAEGPEHDALRRFIEQGGMATLLITYDIHVLKAAAYFELDNAIQSLGRW